MAYKVLIVDDDVDLLKMLKDYFTLKNYIVYTALNGFLAIEQLNETPDIILLDINMPQMDGLELCKRIRNKVTCPILFLTAKAEEQDRVNGLMSGGDDYILKPFSLKELEARMIAHIRREERQSTKSKIRFQQELIIDYLEKALWFGDKKVEFTKTEYQIIEFLSMHPGQVFDKERIYERVLGFDAEGESRVITELIRRIRNKLSIYSKEDWIQTVWGNGYKWRK